MPRETIDGGTEQCNDGRERNRALNARRNPEVARTACSSVILCVHVAKDAILEAMEPRQRRADLLQPSFLFRRASGNCQERTRFHEQLMSLWVDLDVFVPLFARLRADGHTLRKAVDVIGKCTAMQVYILVLPSCRPSLCGEALPVLGRLAECLDARRRCCAARSSQKVHCLG